MIQTIYINAQTAQVTTTPPAELTIVKAEFPEGTDTSVVLPLLVQVLQSSNAKTLNPNYTPPAVAYKVQFGDVV